VKGRHAIVMDHEIMHSVRARSWQSGQRQPAIAVKHVGFLCEFFDIAQEGRAHHDQRIIVGDVWEDA
jgi:hypothetical protein